MSVANSNQKSYLVFVTCTCAPYFENSSATNAYRLPVKQNVSHMDENITELRAQISFTFAGHPCGDMQDVGLNIEPKLCFIPGQVIKF